MYAALIENKVTLHHRIFCACQTIHIRPGTFERVCQRIIRRDHVCIDSGGEHFEHMLRNVIG